MSGLFRDGGQICPPPPVLIQICSMLCTNILYSVRRNPWILIHICCFIAFIFQMTILANNELNPPKTESHVEEKKLEEIPFPVLFKICIKPSFNMIELHKNGYKHVWNYFNRQSRYNRSIYQLGPTHVCVILSRRSDTITQT